MKYTYYILLIFIAFACSNDKNVLQKAEQISQKVGNDFAPDSREAIYTTNFTVATNGNLVVSGETSLPKAKLALFSNLEGLKIHLVDSLVVLPAKKMGDKVWGLINLSVVNLRSHPKHSAELVSQAIMGTPVKVLNQKGSWYQVQTPDKYIAWVDQAAVNLRNKTEMDLWRNSKRIVFLPDFKIARGEDGKQTVTDLVAGSILQVEKEEKTFYKLILPDLRKVKVEKSFCKDFDLWKSTQIEDAAILTATAREFMGRPYLWGGTSSKGVDCSGFVKSVYFMNGIILARDASLQFLHGDTISPEQGFTKLVEGDLVFFGRKASENKTQKVTHVGMYIKDGEFIHSSGRVKLNSFDPKAENYSDYRTVSWLGGRRVLTRIGEEGMIKVSEHPWY
ncbi:C40 family peptidase [Marinifilum caeruleilacunae]|uniref:Glycoside hydrolase n=1 Tax=Marinifilum caeruleilacunae TaxID=2499076 RepID=A0ABX1X0M6_9BACT|nr:C40 family peptidase [Marinifilum caeruleilacunae]NOU61832.1 glycoside hydrolase [Marinifilum caeruleilacunae]